MLNLIRTRNLLLILFVVYYAQGSLYAQGTIISQAALALIMVISIFYCLKTLYLKNNKNTFYKVWAVLLALNVIGFVFTSDMSNPLGVTMFRGVLMASLPFFPFYYFAQKGILRAKHLKWFFLIMLPITILQYQYSAARILAEQVYDNTDIVNNTAYAFVGLIPFVFLFKRKLFAIGFVLILTYFIIQGAKRGALLCGAIGLLCFIYYQMRTIPKKNKFKSYFIALVVLMGLSYYIYDLLNHNQYLLERMQGLEKGSYSGRDVIYENIFNAWNNNSTSYINLLFGFGFAASLRYSGSGHFAHNDWLELLSNFGLLGVCIYLAVFYIAVKYVRFADWKLNKRLMMLTIILIWLLTTVFSMAYTASGGYVKAILLAYLVGSRRNNLT